MHTTPHQIKGGSFKSMHLNSKLFHSIKHSNPTPVQRKAIPLLLQGSSTVVIARTGSGKTLCYLIPVIEKFYAGESSVIICATLELVHQVKRMFGELSSISLTVLSRMSSNDKNCRKDKDDRRSSAKRSSKRETQHCDRTNDHTETEESKPQIIIATLGTILHASLTIKPSLLVLDEADRILDNPTAETEYAELLEALNPQQIAFFSATLSVAILANSCNFEFLQIDNGLSETLKHTFLYCPESVKIGVLRDVLKIRMGPWCGVESNDTYESDITRDSGNTRVNIFDDNTTRESNGTGEREDYPQNKRRITLRDPISNSNILSHHNSEPKIKKTIIFCATKYSVDLLKEKLGLPTLQIYGDMDPCHRTEEMQKFIKSKSAILIVTDLASRGLNIPDLELVINFNMCDSTNFVHRVGRVARNGRIGEQITLVSHAERHLYNSILGILKTCETETNSAESSSTTLWNVPSRYFGDLECSELRIARRGLQKARRYMHSGTQGESLKLGPIHKMFEIDSAREEFVNSLRFKVKEEEEVKEEKSYKDQFYVPYKKSVSLIAPVWNEGNKRRWKK